MTKAELIKLLEPFDDDAEVIGVDEHNMTIVRILGICFDKSKDIKLYLDYLGEPYRDN